MWAELTHQFGVLGCAGEEIVRCVHGPAARRKDLTHKRDVWLAYVRITGQGWVDEGRNEGRSQEINQSFLNPTVLWSIVYSLSLQPSLPDITDSPSRCSDHVPGDGSKCPWISPSAIPITLLQWSLAGHCCGREKLSLYVTLLQNLWLTKH